MSLTSRSLPPCSVDELFINTIRQCTSLGRHDISKFTSRRGYHKHCLTWVKIYLERETFLSGILSGFLSPAFPLQCDRSHAPLDCCVCHCFTVGISPLLHRRDITLAQICQINQLCKSYWPSDPNSPPQAVLGNKAADPTCYYQLLSSSCSAFPFAFLVCELPWRGACSLPGPAPPHCATPAALPLAGALPFNLRSRGRALPLGCLRKHLGIPGGMAAPAGWQGRGRGTATTTMTGDTHCPPALGRRGQLTSSGRRRTHGRASDAAKAVAGPDLNSSLGMQCYQVLRETHAFVL